ncbi:ABC transporter ATP-binding protein [Paenarthrobacter aurescens]|uniref:ABC transporter ATP-binding protein n=1 Tax=Paenarthrobacter aurescens TaxID=43663 RepID=UPI0021BF25AC|nr:ATP-binding cassette domain-containing protein [Paenarthrobacter aurescens]MCT9870511.1 ATP-binding cassette domain-containing protein [Paenarthrobacter aurescens]
MQLRAEGVSVVIDGKPVLDSVSVQAEPGRMLVLAGKSGSGKTTLLNVLGLLRRVDTGTVLVGDQNATKWNDARRRRFWRDHVAFVFQDYGLIEESSVEYNVTVGRRGILGLRPAQRERVNQVLSHVLLSGRGKEQTARLSGGEKQRVGLARAMFRGADIVLADEPTASLDRKNRELVINFLIEEARRGATVVVATHDEDLMDAGDDLIRLGEQPAPEPSAVER